MQGRMEGVMEAIFSNKSSPTPLNLKIVKVLKHDASYFERHCLIVGRFCPSK